MAAFDPEKRGKKTIIDHLESVRNLALSRDGRREASRSKGLADSAAMKENSFSTPEIKTSMINVSLTSLIPNYYQKVIYFLSNIQCKHYSDHPAYCTTTHCYSRIREIAYPLFNIWPS